MKHLLFLTSVIFILFGCSGDTKELNHSSFIGAKEDIKRAEAFFETIGGKEKWASIKSLYIKANHEEPNLDSPYVSEIWRAIDEFKLKIEQSNQDFHNVGYFSEEGGWIKYLHRDTSRRLSQESLERWKYEHSRNIYVVLSKLSKSGEFKVNSGNNQRLEFQDEKGFLCAFELDSLAIPRVYITLDEAGEEQQSHFKDWGTTQGMGHSAGGGPIDGSFSYSTTDWVPSFLSFDASYSFDLNHTHQHIFEGMDWLHGSWKNVNPNSEHFEIWDENYSSIGFKLEHADTSFYEELRLEIRNDELYLDAKVRGQNENRAIPFKLVLNHEGKYIFSNRKHDFPQYISYEKVASDTLRTGVRAQDDPEMYTSVFARQH